MEFDLAKGMAVLERTPSVLRALLAGLPEEWTHRDEGPDTWSPFDVVGHLIDGEEADWMARVRIILSESQDRRFTPFERSGHLQRRERETLAGRLDRFAELRTRNLAELRALRLGPQDLQRTGVHPAFGTVRLEQHLATWVAHDLGHIVQAARVMARQYRDAVGPWTAYLSVMGRAPGGP
ncbi:MAG: hypothetical protein AMXMBFR53_24950 [Gemmatimonadota bacterium]